MASLTNIHTAEYRSSHQCNPKPSQDGAWLFRDADGAVVELNGKFKDVIRQLPDGRWTVLP